jgi:hypothetical protein
MKGFEGTILALSNSYGEAELCTSWLIILGGGSNPVFVSWRGMNHITARIVQVEGLLKPT